MLPGSGSKHGAAAVRTHAALLLLLLAPLAPLMLSSGKQAAASSGQSRLGHFFAWTAPARRGKVYLRYDNLGGLCNQLNSHINGLTLGHALGVDAVLVPPAWSRTPDSFNSATNHTWARDNPVGTLLDLRAMDASWAQRGIRLLEASAHLQDLEWQGCVRTPALDKQVRAAMPGTPKYATAPLMRLVAQARTNIDAVWAQHGPSTCVLLDAVRAFLASSLVSSANLAASTAASLRFPPHIEALADRVAEGIGPVFNGVHLRIERDMGLNPEAVVPKYVSLMRELGFSAAVPLYVASALLSYQDAAGFDRMAALLQNERLCSRAVAKEHILPAADFAGLNSEQVALVDLLVLSRAARFVGHRVSTFSSAANDLRVIRSRADAALGQLVDWPKNEVDPGNSLLPVEPADFPASM